MTKKLDTAALELSTRERTSLEPAALQSKPSSQIYLGLWGGHTVVVENAKERFVTSSGRARAALIFYLQFALPKGMFGRLASKH
jgi:hypothetical protein